MLPINLGEKISYFFTLPKEVSVLLFTCIREPKDYVFIARTCKYLHSLSISIPVIAFSSLSSRRFLLRHSLLSNSRLIDAAFKVITSKNFHFCTFGRADAMESALIDQEQFYLEFKESCKQLNINMNDKEFLHCVFDLKGLYKYFSGYVRQKTYMDIVNAYSEQPIKRISLSSLSEKIKDLLLLYKEKSLIEVEMDLRRSLKLNKKTGFYESAIKLQNTDLNAMVSKIEKRLKIQFEIEKMSIENELQILNCPYAHHGSIDESHQLMQLALNDRNAARLVFMKVSGSTTHFSLNIRHFKTSSPEIQAAFDQLVSMNKQFCLARERCIRLVARQSVLACRNKEGNLSGGKLYQVVENLNNLHEIALHQVTSLIRFYFELDRDVTECNKQKRHNALLRIIETQTPHPPFPPFG